MSDVSIALNRFGLGARPDETVPGDAKRWLDGQFARYEPRPAALAGVAATPAIIADIADYQEQARTVRMEKREAGAAPTAAAPAMTGEAMDAPANPASNPAALPVQPDNPAMLLRRDARKALRGHYVQAIDARVSAALVTPAPFVERMVYFWANHFAVSAMKVQVTPLVGAFEFEAIRPHVLGSFSDMLGAVERHPAMLYYLDQAQSIGPDSQFGQRPAAQAKRRGLNENLAREIMELHTLGVRTGYDQADVTEFARALTGWTVPGLRGPTRGQVATQDGFGFIPGLHEPGDRTIMGIRYPSGGEEQAQAVLADLARHPATAAHIATKLARHFAGDTPPPAMVARLTQTFLRTKGDLPSLYRAVIASPEAWAAQPLKFRTPWEWSIGAMRAIGMKQAAPGASVGLMNQLGQAVWQPGQPNGYDDIAASWAGPDAVMRRVEAAERFAARTPEVDARALAAKLYPGAVSPATEQAVARAESPGQALALLLVAPEAMRR